MRKHRLMALGTALGVTVLLGCLFYLLSLEAKCRRVKPGMTTNEVWSRFGGMGLAEGGLWHWSERQQAGRVIVLTVDIDYDGNRVARTRVSHWIGPVCLEETWASLYQKLRPTSPSPPAQ